MNINIYIVSTVYNLALSLHCLTEQEENNSTFNRTKPALQKQVPEHSLGIFHAPCKAVVQQDKANHPLGSFLQDDYL